MQTILSERSYQRQCLSRLQKVKRRKRTKLKGGKNV